MLRAKTPARRLPVAGAFSVDHPQLVRLRFGPDTVYSQSKPPVSSTPVADQAYALGETVRVALTIGERVDVTGAPRLKIRMEPARWDARTANYDTGGPTASLTFAHEVVEPNISTQVIAALANTLKLNGGTIRSPSSGGDADLSHIGVSDDDTLIARFDTDDFDGGEASDTASYATAHVGLTVNLADATENTGEAQDESFASVEGPTGSKRADNLDGSTGPDKPEGGHVDAVQPGKAGAGVTVNLGTDAASGRHTDGDTISRFQNVIGSAHAYIPRGGAGNNQP